MRNPSNERRPHGALVLLALILFFVLRALWWLPMLAVLGVWWLLKSQQLEQQRYVGTWIWSYIAAGIITTVLFGLIKVASVALGWIRWPDEPGEWASFGVDIGGDILAAAWLLTTLCLWFVLRQRWLRGYEQEILQDQGQSCPEDAAPNVPIGTKESAVRDRKKFYVLLGMAAWISLVAIFVAYMEGLTEISVDSPLLWLWEAYPRGDPWFSFFALSIPGLAFGTCLFWWFHKEK